MQQENKINVPSIEDSDMEDHTVASPALGFGMEPEPDSQLGSTGAFQPESEPEPASWPEPPIQQLDEMAQNGYTGTLSRHEVAAVNINRPYYVSDTPSPYLSSKQAQEDFRVTKRRHSRIVTVAVILLIAAIAGGGGWFLWNSMHSGIQQSTQVFETATIIKGEYLETVDSTSLVRPVNEEVVTSGVSGSVTEVFVENGTYVEEGEQILRLENSAISSARAKAQQALDTFSKEVDAKAEALDKANEEERKAQAEVDRISAEISERERATSSLNSLNNSSNSNNSNSSNSSNSSSTSEIRIRSVALEAANTVLENARKRVETAQSELDAANDNLWSIQETYNQAVAQEETLNVYAPISGTVSDLSELAAPERSISGSTRICTIADTSSYSIVMEIPDDKQELVSENQEVRLAFPTIDGLYVTTHISWLDRNEEGTLLAIVEISEPDERITKGIAAEASVVLNSIPDTYIVPSAAIHSTDNGGATIEVLLDPSREIVTSIPVTVLANDGTNAAVDASNIQADTSVVISSTPTGTATLTGKK